MNTFNVNVASTAIVTQVFVPLLKKAKGSQIINLSSDLGSLSMVNFPGLGSYRASKAAVNMITRCLDLELEDIKVKSIHPGWVSTDMGTSAAPLKVEDSVKGILGVIDKPPLSDGFYDYNGNVLPW